MATVELGRCNGNGSLDTIRINDADLNACIGSSCHYYQDCEQYWREGAAVILVNGFDSREMLRDIINNAPCVE